MPKSDSIIWQVGSLGHQLTALLEHGVSFYGSSGKP